MNVNAVKHQAKLLEWKGRVADCRSSGMSVKHWCEENDCSPRTYYRWEQEILGKVRQITKAESQPVLAELPVIKFDLLMQGMTIVSTIRQANPKRLC